jgi:nitric oxide reductase NorQ protein
MVGSGYHEYAAEEYLVREEPFYVPVGNEVSVFRTAYEEHLPILLKGPTGCGKTRFVEYMAYRLGSLAGLSLPLITIACHEDLTASDLIGRYILRGQETQWMDGPLTRAVRAGAICYLDEIVEARKDTTVVIHPLTDHRRILPIERLGEVLEANDRFSLVISYNPGYQSVLKDLKQSTRQRFVALEFDYPGESIERDIIRHESGVDDEVASHLARLAVKVRHLREHGLQEGVSTRLMIYTGKLIRRGVAPAEACQTAIVQAVTDDPDVRSSLMEVVSVFFPD